MKLKFTFPFMFRVFSSLWYVLLVALGVYVPWSCESSSDPAAPFLINSAYVGDVPVEIHTTGDTVELEGGHSRPAMILNFSKPILTTSVRSVDFLLSEVEGGSANTMPPLSVSANVQSNTINSTIRVLPEDDLKPGKFYRFEVSPRLKSVGGGTLSSRSILTIYFRPKVPYVKPPSPSTLTISNQTKDGLDVSWSQEDNFGMELSTNTPYAKGTPPFVVQVLVGGVYVSLPAPPIQMVINESTKTAVLSGLSPNSTYKIRVGAVNTRPDTSWSAPYEVKTASAAQAPTRVRTISRRSVSSTSLEIEWASPLSWGLNGDGSSASAATAPYKVQYATTKSGPYTSAGVSVDQGNLRATATGLTQGALYYFVVEASNGEGLWSSDTSRGLTMFVASAPTQPRVVNEKAVIPFADLQQVAKAKISFEIDPNYKDKSSLGYNKSGNAASLKLLSYEYKKGTESYSTPTNILPGAKQSVILPDLDPDTTYTFRIIVENDESLSDTLVHDIRTPSASSKPSKGKSIQKVSATDTTIKIKWSEPYFGRTPKGVLSKAGQHPYIVKYSTAKNGPYVSSNVTISTLQGKPEAEVKKLDRQNMYYFIVVARNAEGLESEDTSSGFQLDKTTKPRVNKPLVNDVTTDVRSDSVRLTWTKVEKTSDYGTDENGDPRTPASVHPLYIEWTVRGSKQWYKATTDPADIANETTAWVTGLSPNTTYQFRLVAVNEQKDTGYSAHTVDVRTKKVQVERLSYSPASKVVLFGVQDSSALPTLEPSVAKVGYEVMDKSGNKIAGISIDRRGKIQLGRNTKVGEYDLLVRATGKGDYEGAVEGSYALEVMEVNVLPLFPKVPVGGAIQLKAEVNTVAKDKGVSWLSSDPSVASVDRDGVVRGVQAGEVEITVKTNHGGQEVNVKVKVDGALVKVDSVSMNKSKMRLKINTKETLLATVFPRTATDKNVRWKSSDETIATVSSSGEVTSLKPGVVWITATSEEGLKEGQVRVVCHDADAPGEPTDLQVQVATTATSTNKDRYYKVNVKLKAPSFTGKNDDGKTASIDRYDVYIKEGDVATNTGAIDGTYRQIGKIDGKATSSDVTLDATIANVAGLTFTFRVKAVIKPSKDVDYLNEELSREGVNGVSYAVPDRIDKFYVSAIAGGSTWRTIFFFKNPHFAKGGTDYLDSEFQLSSVTFNRRLLGGDKTAAGRYLLSTLMPDVQLNAYIKIEGKFVPKDEFDSKIDAFWYYSNDISAGYGDVTLQYWTLSGRKYEQLRHHASGGSTANRKVSLAITY